MAKRRKPPVQLAAPACPLEQRVEQARRQRRRGDARKALVLLREACFLAGADARLWVLYAAQTWRMGRLDDTRHALRQALWLRERAHDEPRARVVRSLLEAAEAGAAFATLRAA
jgi:Flp pilus assembly protein TadD